MNNIGLYRAKRKDNGEWVEGYYVYNKLNDKHYIVIENERDDIPFSVRFMFYEVIPKTVDLIGRNTDTLVEIINLLKEVIKRLGGDSAIQSIVNAFDDTLEDEEVLNELKAYLEGER